MLHLYRAYVHTHTHARTHARTRARAVARTHMVLFVIFFLLCNFLLKRSKRWICFRNITSISRQFMVKERKKTRKEGLKKGGDKKEGTFGKNW